MYKANCAIRLGLSSCVDLEPLCEQVKAILLAAKDKGQLFVAEPELSDCTGPRSDCTSVSSVSVEWRDNLQAMLSFDLEFTECYSHDWIVSLYVPIIEAALITKEKLTFTYVAGDVVQEVKVLGWYADWDFPEVG